MMFINIVYECYVLFWFCLIELTRRQTTEAGAFFLDPAFVSSISISDNVPP